jgi:hypothetical protein
MVPTLNSDRVGTISMRLLLSEGRDSMRGTEAGGAVITRNRRAQIAATAASASSGSYIEQSAGMPVRIATVIHRGSVDAIDAGDQRSCDARSTEY